MFDKTLREELKTLYKQLTKCKNMDPGEDECTNAENEIFSEISILIDSLRDEGLDK